MKKMIVCFSVVMFFVAPMILAAGPSDPPTDPITNPMTGWNYPDADTILGYESFQQGNETTELAFANLVLAEYGLGPTELLNGTGMKVTDLGDPIALDWDFGFAWLYAAVKVDGPNDYTYLFVNDYLGYGANYLTTPFEGSDPYNMGDPPHGISGITFFGPSSVPEPTALLLLGVGLVGLAGVKRKLHN